jgi:hypothetical protein
VFAWINENCLDSEGGDFSRLATQFRKAFACERESVGLFLQFLLCAVRQEHYKADIGDVAVFEQKIAFDV